MLATVAAANVKKVQIKKYSVFIYSEAEPHAMYAIYKLMRKLCVPQYHFGKSIFLKIFAEEIFLIIRLITLYRIFHNSNIN